MGKSTTSFSYCILSLRVCYVWAISNKARNKLQHALMANVKITDFFYRREKKPDSDPPPPEDISEPDFKCRNCHRVFESRAGLLSHRRTHHQLLTQKDPSEPVGIRKHFKQGKRLIRTHFLAPLAKIFQKIISRYLSKSFVWSAAGAVAFWTLKFLHLRREVSLPPPPQTRSLKPRFQISLSGSGSGSAGGVCCTDTPYISGLRKFSL